MSDEKTASAAAPVKLLLFTYGQLGVLTQVEFPDKFRANDSIVKVERSSEGALHLRPSSTVMLTESEKAYLDKHHPAVARHLLFVGEHATAEEKLKARLDAEMAAAQAAAAASSSGSSGGPPNAPDAGGSGGGANESASESAPKGSRKPSRTSE